MEGSRYRGGAQLFGLPGQRGPGASGGTELSPRAVGQRANGDALKAGDVAEALQRYRSYRADPRHVYADTEEKLNGLGYRLLKEKRTDDAITLFKLNVAAHPGSANAYDSLGEAYLMADQREAAIAVSEVARIGSPKRERPVSPGSGAALTRSGGESGLPGSVPQ